MIDWNNYDPSHDACEEESHFCNSLNAEFGFIRHMLADPDYKDIQCVPIEKEHLDRLSDYGLRAQATIQYLQGLNAGQDNAIEKLKRTCLVLANRLPKDVLEEALQQLKEEEDEQEVSAEEAPEGSDPVE